MTLTVIMVIMIDISKLKHGYNHDHDQGDYTPTYGHPSNSYTAGEGEETLDYVFYRWSVILINTC